MASKYLSALSEADYNALTEKLCKIQSGICFICQKEIDTNLQITNIDHVVPLANKGKDSEDNFAVTHESCNKSKQDSNLYIARVLHRLKALQEKIQEDDNRSASLKDLLEIEKGSTFEFKSKIDGGSLVYSFSEISDNTIYRTPIFTDKLSGESTTFIEVPLEYIHHDSLINPRGINSSISLLVKEFYKGHPPGPPHSNRINYSS